MWSLFYVQTRLSKGNSVKIELYSLKYLFENLNIDWRVTCEMKYLKEGEKGSGDDGSKGIFELSISSLFTPIKWSDTKSWFLLLNLNKQQFLEFSLALNTGVSCFELTYNYRNLTYRVEVLIIVNILKLHSVQSC